jgi:hypothetical protein
MEIVPGLVSCATENRSTVGTVVQTTLTDRINNRAELESVLATDLAMHLTWCINLGNKQGVVPPKAHEFWNHVSNEIYKACSKRIESLAPRHSVICNEVFQRRTVELVDLIKWHGTEGFFRTEASVMFPHFWPLSPAQLLLGFAALSSSTSTNAADARWETAQLAEAARILPTQPQPWLAVRRELTSGVQMWMFGPAEKEGKRPNRKFQAGAEVIFGAFLVAATLFEVTPDWERTRLLQSMKTTRVPLFASLGPLLLARVGQGQPAVVGRAIGDAGLNAVQEDLLRKWISRQLSFSAPQSSNDDETER